MARPLREGTDTVASQPWLQDLLAACLLGTAVVFVFHGALKFYFAQEDFQGLAAAAGVYPRHNHLWRYVSVQAFMDFFYPLFRDRPWPYHAVGLALHCVNAGLLFALLSRRFTRPAALVGASFFAVHPALFTALYWQSARPDILAAMFGLLTVIFALRSGRERWLAVPSFALSLLSKESTLPLPAVIALLAWWLGRKESGHPGTGWKPDWLLIALLAMTAAYLPYLARPRGAGIGIAFDTGAAYAFDFGASLDRNLLTYAGWTADLAMLKPGLRFVDRQNPAIFPFAIVVLCLAAVLVLWPRLRQRGWLVGLVSFFLLLVPVLPLANHTYHYYLYLPLTAGALCLAAFVDAIFSALTPAPVLVPHQKRGKPPQPREASSAAQLVLWIVAVACWIALTWNGSRVVTQIERRPSPVYPGLRGDPIIDRSLIAERAIKSLRAASIPSGTELVFILRERIALIARIIRGSGEQPAPPQEIYPESNVKAALFDGIGVRALVPAVDSVRFAIALGQPTPRRRYAVYAPTGEVEVYDAASIDSLLRSSWVTRW